LKKLETTRLGYFAALRTLSFLVPPGIGRGAEVLEEVALSGELVMWNSMSELSDSELRLLLLFVIGLMSTGLEVETEEPRPPPCTLALSIARTASLAKLTVLNFNRM